MKVSATLKGTTDEQGRKTIYIRVNNGNKRTFKHTGIRVEPSQFKNGKVINHPKSKQYNEVIKNSIIRTEFGSLNGSIKFPDADFRTFTLAAFREWEKVKKQSTLNQYYGEMERFLKYSGEIKISRLTDTYLKNYKEHVLKTKSVNTAWKVFKFIKLIINKAHREKIIENNPLDMFENIVYKNPKKEYLASEQLKAIDEYVTSRHCPERIAFIGNWFLIGCYTGLRYSDMNNYDKKRHLKGHRLYLHTTKTNEVVSLPMEGKILELFERIKYKPLDISNQKANDYIKVIAKACDITENVNWHMSRHTFAVRCADAKLSMEVTAKFMGITNLKTVAIYYKLLDKNSDEWFGLINQ